MDHDRLKVQPMRQPGAVLVIIESGDRSHDQAVQLSPHDVLQLIAQLAEALREVP